MNSIILIQVKYNTGTGLPGWMLKRALTMQHMLAKILSMQSMHVIFPNPLMVDFKVFCWASMMLTMYCSGGIADNAFGQQSKEE
jgi:hypothetical protein